MPIASVPVPPRNTSTTVQVWMCCICGAAAARYGDLSTAPQDAAVHVAAIGWAFLVDGEVVCDRCKMLPGIAFAIDSPSSQAF